MIDVAGLDTIELGCGTGYVSAWLARRGARPVAVDNSPKQLETATRLQREHGIDFPLLLGNAERVPYPDASFDLAISEYGACLWADPYVWVPEAARLLRTDGRLVFLTNGFVLMLCAPDEDNVPAGEHLLRSAFGMHRFEWPDDPSVEFHLNHGDWVRLLRAHGFEILDLLELRAPPGAAAASAPYVSFRVGAALGERRGLDRPQARLTNCLLGGACLQDVKVPLGVEAVLPLFVEDAQTGIRAQA